MTNKDQVYVIQENQNNDELKTYIQIKSSQFIIKNKTSIHL